jgi:hypothetical protein
LVGVAQLVELRVVVPAVAGSNPVAHPSKGLQSGHFFSADRRRAARRGRHVGATAVALRFIDRA